MKKEFLHISSKQETCKIRLEDITTMERVRGKTAIATTKEVVYANIPLGILEENLSRNFLRPHTFLIVNLDNVVMMKGQTIFLEGEQKVYLGKNIFAETRKEYHRYLEEIDILLKNKTKAIEKP